MPRLFQARVDENQEGIEPTWQVVAKRIVQGQLGSPSAEGENRLGYQVLSEERIVKV